MNKMKYAVLVPDGMADYPLEELGGRTPLEVARTPNMDFLAQNGKVGRANFVPEGMTPGSDICNLAILGYDPLKYFSGRAPLEASNLGLDIGEDQVAFRCNFITEENGALIDYSAGHITTKEAQVLIKALNRELGSAEIKFFPGVSYRHLMLIRGDVNNLTGLKTRPPHDIIGHKIEEEFPREAAGQVIVELMQRSRAILDAQDINQVRRDLKENPANMIWLWGQGKKIKLPSFKQKYGLNGAVISAVDLIKGIAKTVGMTAVNVPGATGYYDTDYEAKGQYAINSLEKNDFVFVHVESPDEAGHNADVRAKIAAIENFDRSIVGKFVEKIKKDPNFRVMVIPDHPTPIALKTHTSDPVCLLICGRGVAKDEIQWYTENEAMKSQFVFDKGYELMDCFIHQENI